jgi:hypothetical protein
MADAQRLPTNLADRYSQSRPTASGDTATATTHSSRTPTYTGHLTVQDNRPAVAYRQVALRKITALRPRWCPQGWPYEEAWVAARTRGAVAVVLLVPYSSGYCNQRTPRTLYRAERLGVASHRTPSGRVAVSYGSEGWGFESLRAREIIWRLTCRNVGWAPISNGPLWT